MIYYLLHEKERAELESILSREIEEVNGLIEGVDDSNWIKRRALLERKHVLFNIKKKIQI